MSRLIRNNGDGRFMPVTVNELEKAKKKPKARSLDLFGSRPRATALVRRRRRTCAPPSRVGATTPWIQRPSSQIRQPPTRIWLPLPSRTDGEAASDQIRPGRRKGARSA